MLVAAVVTPYVGLGYADDIVLFAPSAKGLQMTINMCYAYGCDNDMIFNSSKSQVMFLIQ